jgi:hypothetical protein
MEISNSALVIASVWFLGCSGSDGETTAPAANTTTLTMEAFEIPPGQQGIECQNFKNPTGKRIEIAAWQAESKKGAHHLHAYVTDAPKEDALHECDQLEFAFLPLQYASQQGGQSSLTYPSGVAAVLEPDQGVLLRVHYLNAEADAVTAQSSVTIRWAEAGAAERHVAPITLVNPALLIPPGATKTISQTCAIKDDIDLVWMISHMHQHGVGFEATVAGEPLYEADSGEAPIKAYAPVKSIAAGQEITFACNLRARTFRSDEARRRDPRGSGLGLAITSEVCARCGWALSFSAEEPRGLRVRIAGACG